MKTFDPTKPVRLSDGRAARIICTDRKGANNDCVVVLYPSKVFLGTETVGMFREDGTHPQLLLFLENIPEETFKYQNVYKEKTVGAKLWTSKEDLWIGFRKDMWENKTWGYNEYKFVDGEPCSVRFVKHGEE